MKLAIASLILASTSALADYRVIGITDGDTLTLIDEANQQTKVRISAIDAPERAQPYGQYAKQALSDVCYGKNATIRYVDTDRYGRTVADVSCDGIDAGQHMVSKGMAWVYDKYSSGYEYLYPMQEQAKAATFGLWGDWQNKPVPPSEWRKSK
ncbi:hypothetical protein GCM10009007_03040 [Formosimonas limnophila]|uniref:TNase-like domain-containing protein n=1 Tax=Formosimonas limnophila TaxID=1384487 RepID=A0A8J3FXM4_9BURK|nr:thermonuclease family protein [Formosimonas limnophila]GHA65989.1 hypothetical protein GCM10009007_03040 [Formosimonas limnophila]